LHKPHTFIIILFIALSASTLPEPLHQVSSIWYKDAKTSSSQSLPDPLQQANEQLASVWYEDSRAKLADGLVPVYVDVGRDNITVYRGNTVIGEEGGRVPEIYTQLKLCSHVMLAMETLLLPVTIINGGVVDDDTLIRLKYMNNSMVNSMPLLGRRNFTNEQFNRNTIIIQQTITFLSNVITTNFVSYFNLLNYTDSVMDLVMLNVKDASEAELLHTHQIMMRMKKLVSEDEWNMMYVNIHAGHMPRLRYSIVQYFERLLNTTVDSGERISVAEVDLYPVQLMQDHVVQKHISLLSFHNPYRMHEDLMADVAANYIPKLFE